MGQLTADAIRVADDTQTEDVPVPEWGQEGDYVTVRGLTAIEKDQYDREIVKIDNRGNAKMGRLDNLRALLSVRCIVDSDGERMFRDSDARMLGEKSSLVVGRIWAVAARLSGMREEETEEEAEDLDEAQPDDSSSE